jgi:hypothetical protein
MEISSRMPERGTLIWKYKLVLPLWKLRCSFLKKLKIGLENMVEMTEFLPNKCMILCSNPSTIKKLKVELPHHPATPTILEHISKGVQINIQETHLHTHV